MEELLASEETVLCPWNIFDDNAKVVMGVGLYVTGIFALFLNCWLLLTFLKGSLSNQSYFMVLNLCLVSLARNLLAGFPFTGTSAIAHSWVFGETNCKVFAFLNQFIGVYHIEALTHMCIERYVAAKYVKFGWQMSSKHYALFVALCWFFSVLYSTPALIGFWQYSCDLTDTACGLDLVWSDGQAWQKWSTVVFATLGGVKPLVVISGMLWQATQIEKKHYTAESHQEQMDLTQTVNCVTLGTLCCWLPGGLLVCWMMLPQLMTGAALRPPLLLVFCSSLASEMAPAVPVLVYLWTNPTIKKAMMSFWKNHSDKNE